MAACAPVTASGEHMRRLLAPHRGKWVAVEHGWRRVLAADEDSERCLSLASAVPCEGLPLLYRVPALEPAPAGEG